MRVLTFASLFLATMSIATAQPPREGRDGAGRGQRGRGAANVDDSIKRLLAFDKNEDGQLTEEEVPDKRLRALVTRADGDNDKITTKDELTDLLQKDAAHRPGRGQEMGPPHGGPGPGGPGFGGPGPGPGGFDERGPGGPGFGGPGFGGPEGPGAAGRGGREMGPPPIKPGTLLPDFMLDELKLSDTQREELVKLQALVDSRLADILTSDQQESLKQMGSRPRGENGPPGFGPPSGRPGLGGPGGRDGFGGPAGPANRRPRPE